MPSWGTNLNSPDNRWLRDAMQQIPVIYFLGTSPGRYQPIIPTFIVGWHPERVRVQLAFGASAQAVPPDPPERRYALREVKRGSIRHRFAMPSLRLTADGARSRTCPNPGCSTRPTSSWMLMSTWAAKFPVGHMTDRVLFTADMYLVEYCPSGDTFWESTRITRARTGSVGYSTIGEMGS